MSWNLNSQQRTQIFIRELFLEKLMLVTWTDKVPLAFSKFQLELLNWIFIQQIDYECHWKSSSSIDLI